MTGGESKLVNMSRIRSCKIEDLKLVMITDRKRYIKNFDNNIERDQYLEINFQNDDSKSLEELKKLKEQMKKINENIEEIRDMIKYQPGSQVYMESKEDFDTKKIE